MFDSFIACSSELKQLEIGWLLEIPALVRVPVFSDRTGLGYVVVYVEKTREYQLQCFDPSVGRILWKTGVVNGGYGAPAIGDEVIAVPTGFVSVCGISVRTGEVLWIYNTPARVRSPVAFIDGNFVFSSGENAYVVSEAGDLVGKVSLPGCFLFGIIREYDGIMYSLAAESKLGRSHLSLYAFLLDGSFLWKFDLGDGVVVSSDTSGILICNGNVICAAGKFVCCVVATTGVAIWRLEMPDIVGRQIPTLFGDRLFVPSIGGSVFCLDVEVGALLWTYYGRTIVTTPVSILGELACFCMDGALHLVDAEVGRLVDKICVGHSPYSALTFWQGKAYLGGGDPPYHGSLFCFDFIERGQGREYVCTMKSITDHIPSRGGFVLQVEFEKSTHHISQISVDISAVSNLKSNGFSEEILPIRRVGDAFTFFVPVRRNLVPGIYVVVCKIIADDDSEIFRTGLVSVEYDEAIPNSHLIMGVKPRYQTKYLNSGAACAQVLLEYYGQPIVDQDAIRDMVDYVKERGDCKPFDMWRLVLRRVISSGVASKERLPEYHEVARRG